VRRERLVAIALRAYPRSIRTPRAAVTALAIGLGMALFGHHNGPLTALVLAASPTVLAATAIRSRFVAA